MGSSIFLHQTSGKDFDLLSLAISRCNWEARRILISSSRVAGKKILVLFEEFVSRNQADGLRARKVYIDKSQMPELEEGDFYWNELVGMQVKSTEGIFFWEMWKP